MSKKKNGIIISDDEQDKLEEIIHNKPIFREREHASIRIYQDKDIQNIYQLISEIKIDIIKIKRQISAHDYNIISWLKRFKK